MTGLKGRSEFPETLEVPQGEAEGNIEVEENKTQRFPWDTSNSKLGQICRGFKEHDLITCESKVQVVSRGGLRYNKV